MSYQLSIKKRASKVLANLPLGDYPKVRDAIRALAANPRPSGCKKLAAREGWRIRVGVYRVIYIINDQSQEVVVLDVGHRRDIYR